MELFFKTVLRILIAHWSDFTIDFILKTSFVFIGETLKWSCFLKRLRCYDCIFCVLKFICSCCFVAFFLPIEVECWRLSDCCWVEVNPAYLRCLRYYRILDNGLSLFGNGSSLTGISYP